MRQGEDKFVRVLNELRWGAVSAASCAQLLMCQKEDRSQQWSDGVELTKLYPYNINVRAENEKRLSSLPGELLTFVAEDSIKARGGSRQRLEALGVEKTLQLKVGAQVMCLKNLDVASGLVNGARGVVVGVAANTTTEAGGKLWPKVKFACGLVQVMTPETWSVLEADSIVAERKQVPLSLAWAVSVHKCQGMTLDRVEASLAQAFDHGMVYVALSRVKSLSGLRLRGFAPEKATAHPAVVAFYRSLGCLPPMEEDSASRAPTTSNSSDLASAARQQAHLAALSTDTRQFWLPFMAEQQQLDKNEATEDKNEAAGTEQGQHCKGLGILDRLDAKTMHDPGQDMAQVDLSTLLHAARTDPRLDSAYTRAMRGAYEPDTPRAQDDARGEDARGKFCLESHPQPQGQGQGLVAQQVHAAVVAATASLTTRLPRHLPSHPPPQPVTTQGAAAAAGGQTGASSTWGNHGVLAVRQAVDRQAVDRQAVELCPRPPGSQPRGKIEVKKHIDQWRQRFLSSSVLAGCGAGGGHADGGVGAGASHGASRPSAQTELTDATSTRMQTAAEQERGATQDATQDSTQDAIGAASVGCRSEVEGHVGSSLANAPCSFLTAGPATSEPGPAASDKRRRRRLDDGSMEGTGSTRVPASASTLATTAPPGSAAWSVREQALGTVYKRRREDGGMSGSDRREGAMGARLTQRPFVPSYARNTEFAPASSNRFVSLSLSLAVCALAMLLVCAGAMCSVVCDVICGQASSGARTRAREKRWGTKTASVRTRRASCTAFAQPRGQAAPPAARLWLPASMPLDPGFLLQQLLSKYLCFNIFKRQNSPSRLCAC